MKKQHRALIFMLIGIAVIIGLAVLAIVIYYRASPSTPADNNVTTTNNDVQTGGISIYFSNDQLNTDFDCGDVFSVKRKLSPETPEAAVQAVLEGPRLDESKAGYFTNTGPGTIITDFHVESAEARIDFNSSLYQEARNDCRKKALEAQITKTLQSFGTIKQVSIFVDGKKEQ